MSDKRIHTTVMRIDRGLYEKLVEEASRNERSVNQQVTFFIRQGLNGVLVTDSQSPVSNAEGNSQEMSGVPVSSAS